MIDLHCHILPGIDDGSNNMAQSIQMAREAEKAGFSIICCTPHYLDNRYIVPRDEVSTLITDLQNELVRENINIQLAIGNELYITEYVDELLNNKLISTLNDSKYLLMELPMNYPVTILEDIIFKIQNFNLVPILAHPERYSYVQKDPNFLIDLINRGVLFQGNYASLIGKYGNEAQKTLKILLQHDMIHFLSSDTHRDNSIFTQFDSIFNELNKIISPSMIDKLTNINPKKVIDNEDVFAQEPKEYKKKKFLFF